MYRHELKYIINAGTARALASRLGKLCRRDAYADETGRYRVSSLYFDDYCMSAAEDTISGRLMRKKFRIRVYNGSDALIRLERKAKHNGLCKKDSAVLTRSQYEDIIRGDAGFVGDDPVLSDFRVLARTRLLRPKVIVDYVREAYVYEPGNVRITMDRQVRSCVVGVDLFDTNVVYAPAMEPSDIILEVKYTGFLPCHIARLLPTDCGIRQAASKYTLCSQKLLY